MTDRFECCRFILEVILTGMAKLFNTRNLFETKSLLCTVICGLPGLTEGNYLVSALGPYYRLRAICLFC